MGHQDNKVFPDYIITWFWVREYKSSVAWSQKWFFLPMGIGVVVVYLLGNCKLGARAYAGLLQESYCIWKQSCDCPCHLMKLVIFQWFSKTYLALAPVSVELNGMCLTCNILVFSSDTDLYTSSWDQYCLRKGKRWAVKPSLCTSLLD